ncbi:hypothetical protein [Orbus mooreae]|uniref:hypothetical protein n=1 Tax=Orbus mooreae TaxID=3074107 RepID=UPI00370D209F
MTIYQDHISVLNVAQPVIYYPQNRYARGISLREKETEHPYNTLLPDEIIEQSLALIHVIIECHNPSIKESLILLLEERLQLLKIKLSY